MRQREKLCKQMILKSGNTVSGDILSWRSVGKELDETSLGKYNRYSNCALDREMNWVASDHCFQTNFSVSLQKEVDTWGTTDFNYIGSKIGPLEAIFGGVFLKHISLLKTFILQYILSMSW